ncbi:MAG: ASCH domain-containing protein [Maritimibacter sp.]|uniref:ASCH domain-containing protein n=1 Tax=Maritimibacter sp. TaxID=2003363 RepID=UPI001D7111E6|nr:ASCH domain-containing protein [Maritimibacter sp.]MBL6427308.1 ASCH domain-containing protein [Maritimibacter sp.]
MTDDMEDLNQTYPGAGNFTFGDTPKLCADLLALVRAGTKTATCERLSEFDGDPDARPKVGRCDIAMNWDGTPALVIRTTQVDEVAFKDVTEEMALAEGENDDLAGWRADHEAYFTRNGGFDENMMLLFEHFELVEDLADR